MKKWSNKLKRVIKEQKWQEAKRKYDKLVQTDNAAIPTEQKSLSDYL